MQEISEEEAMAALSTRLEGALELSEFDDIEDSLDLFQLVQKETCGENSQAESLYKKAMTVMRTDLEDREDLLENLPKPLRAVVKNLASAVDIFKAVSKDSVNLAKKAWANVIGSFGKLIKGIGKHLGSETIEHKGEMLVQISEKKLESIPSVGHHTKALLAKRKSVRSQSKGR